jgi:hypothetical protein
MHTFRAFPAPARARLRRRSMRRHFLGVSGWVTEVVLSAVQILFVALTTENDQDLRPSHLWKARPDVRPSGQVESPNLPEPAPTSVRRAPRPATIDDQTGQDRRLDGRPHHTSHPRPASASATATATARAARTATTDLRDGAAAQRTCRTGRRPSRRPTPRPACIDRPTPPTPHDHERNHRRGRTPPPAPEGPTLLKPHPHLQPERPENAARKATLTPSRHDPVSFWYLEVHRTYRIMKNRPLSGVHNGRTG